MTLLPTDPAQGTTRRDCLRGIVAVAAGGALPAIHSKQDLVLRVLGTHVTLQEDLRKRAEADLGFRIEFHPGGSASVLHRASTRPESFDLYEQWSNSMRVLWQANAIQPIDSTRILEWDRLNELSKTGRITRNARMGAGDSPHLLLFAQSDGRLGPNPSKQISFLPYVHNVDSFGYNGASIAEGKAYETESWGWLLDEAHRGRVALVNEPTIGIFDAALAARARGLVDFEDIGAITRTELDELFGLLITLKQEGHFRGFWSSVPESVELMLRDEVRIESMFSPAATSLRGQGVPCVYSAPKEGYRGWHGVMCLSAATRGPVADLAYEYMNWWLSGWPGAFIARQGYYIPNSDRSRPFLSAAEWAYWYEGKVTPEDLRGPDGNVVAKKGDRRKGGSYVRRFSNVAVWNTVMDTYEYSLRRWNDLLAS